MEKQKIERILDSLNLKKEAEELGVSIWKTPSFLFSLMGLIIICAVITVYLISKHYDSPELLIGIETGMVIALFAIGNTIIAGVNEIAKANKMKSEFVSVASHQLKGPLAEINWEIELLLSKYKEGLNEKQEELVRNITKSNNQLVRLVNDLLDVARIDQGRLPLLKEEFDIAEVIKEVIKSNELLAKTNKVGIRMNAYGETPRIMGDKRRIIVVIDNLISNSIKYNSTYGNVDVGITPEKDRIVVCVKDDGIGIDKKDQDKIFLKFYRSENALKNDTEGTGLGLYVAKNIVERSGGDMWFSSEEGKGSTFCFSLPISKKESHFTLK